MKGKHLKGKHLKETELYEPVKKWLEACGCKLQAELQGIDIFGQYDDVLTLAVELKTQLNLEVICQAAERQTRADIVFIAVPENKGLKRSKRSREIMRVLRRLNIGLLSVVFGKKKEDARVRCLLLPDYPSDFKRYIKPLAKKKKALIEEFKARQLNVNIAGSSQTKLMTLYRERAYQIALQFLKQGTMAPKAVSVEGLTRVQINRVLSINHYGWFQRIERGKYGLTPDGITAAEAFCKAHPELAKAMLTDAAANDCECDAQKSI